MQRKIARGGWAGLAGPVLSAVGAYFGVVIPPDKVGSISRQLGQIFDGAWETAAEIIITNIAMAFQQKELESNSFKLENFESKAWIYSNSDGRFGTYRGDDYSDQYWKIIEGTGVYRDYFKFENFESKAWIYSSSDGRFGTYRGDDYSDQYWRKILKV